MKTSKTPESLAVLGIDISQKTFHVALLKGGQTTQAKSSQFDNTPD
ncbi:hypothetical protein POG22_13800 [Geitlerinema sp. CS-897]|nr:hypothetical protein [Geitlerinema sp. CS-897]